MKLMHSLSLLVSFVVEVAMLFAFYSWGNHHFGSLIGLVLVALGIGLWGVWAAPKSSRRLVNPYLFWLKFSLFILAGAAFYFSAQVRAGSIFTVVAIGNLIFARSLDIEPPVTKGS